MWEQTTPKAYLQKCITLQLRNEKLYEWDYTEMKQMINSWKSATASLETIEIEV